MTDAFESYAGKSREANLGVMAKGRFQAAMGDIFKGIPYAALKVISREYGAGDPDPRDPGGFMQVKWKQFAIDFDEIELAPRRGPDPEDMKDMLPALLQLRRVATKQKLDLTDAFEEAAGKGRDAQLGLMAKNRRGRPPHARAHAPAVRCGAPGCAGTHQRRRWRFWAFLGYDAALGQGSSPRKQRKQRLPCIITLIHFS